MEERFKVIHINSTIKDRYPTVDGQLNSEPIIEKGEIAVNTSEDGEFLAIVNTANKIKTFKDWNSIKNEIDKKSYVLDCSLMELASGYEVQASFFKPLISSFLQGVPVFMYDGRFVYPLVIKQSGDEWIIQNVTFGENMIPYRFAIPYNVLGLADDELIEYGLSNLIDYELISKYDVYTKEEVDEKILTVKEFTLDGTSGELPLSEWDSLVNADLYICNGTYIYSHVLNGNIINFNIVTNMASTSTLLTSTTIAFYSIENDGEKLIWSNRTYTGNLVENVVEELGDGEHVVVSQKGITQQINAIKNDYQKKIISVATSETSKTINPNTYYKWGTMTSLNISLNTNVDTSILNEYIFEFTSGTTPTTLSLPSSIKWLNGVAPLIEQNKTYQVSIINNLGIITMFK